MRERYVVPLMLAPSFVFLIFFYGFPTLSNLFYSFTDLSLLGLKKGGSYIGFKNYIELFTSKISFEYFGIHYFGLQFFLFP